jgi:hypothetical protein
MTRIARSKTHRSRRRETLLALLVSLAAMLVAGCGGGGEEAPDGAAAAEDWPLKAIWGPVSMPDGSPALPVYERLGVDVLEMQLRWSEIAPSRPSDARNPADPRYEWPRDVDTAVRDAPAHGIDVAILVTTTPAWANGGGPPIQAADDPSDFADFLAAAAHRYPDVHRWMIWGEANRADRFLPNAVDSPVGPRAYAELLDAAYGALKQASPDNVVIGGMTWTGGEVRPPDFIRWMKLPSGQPPRLDWYGHNPYPIRFPDLANPPYPGGYRDLSDADTLASEVDTAYAPRGISPPLWFSEFTVQSGHGSQYLELFVSEEQQARWLQAAYDTAADAGDVAGLGWFTLLDQPEAPGSGAWGLMTSAGQPKPAFAAYRSVGS